MWRPYHKGMFLYRRRNHSYDNGDFGMSDFLLSEPNTVKVDNELKKTGSLLEIGHSSMQGYRKTMEDKHIISDFHQLTDHTLVAVMDGHSGKGAAILTSERLLDIIENTSTWKEYEKLRPAERKEYDNIELISRSFVQAMVDMDNELRESSVTNGSGCTCVCAIITPTHIVCSNVGDSRCVIGSNGKVISMSEDHKPSLPDETKRIKSAGGMVKFDRVNGELAMSRALGDFQYKNNKNLPQTEQLVICIPDISIHERRKEDEFLIVACDGIWDVMSNTDAVTFLADVDLKFGNAGKVSDEQQKSKRQKLEFKSFEASVINDGKSDSNISSLDLAEALVDLSLVSGSTDNLSCIVARLKAAS